MKFLVMRPNNKNIVFGDDVEFDACLIYNGSCQNEAPPPSRHLEDAVGVLKEELAVKTNEVDALYEKVAEMEKQNIEMAKQHREEMAEMKELFTAWVSEMEGR